MSSSARGSLASFNNVLAADPEAAIDEEVRNAVLQKFTNKELPQLVSALIVASLTEALPMTCKQLMNAELQVIESKLKMQN